MTTEQIIGLAANVAALILAIVAIWLTVQFYKMSEAAQRRTEDAARSIGGSVDRLENLFAHLYADTFSMMRDTYSDMRRHVFPEPADAAATELAEQRIAAIREEVVTELASTVARGQRTEHQVEELRGRVESLVSKAITETREVDADARDDTQRAHILAFLSGRHARSARAEVVLRAIQSADIPTTRWLTTLGRMRDEGLLEYDGDHIGPATVIRLAADS
jgi:hypothetical protein